MEIIKQGDLDFLKKTKKFNCNSCGCIFMADRNEYEYAGVQYNIQYYKHMCPTCGTWAYAED